MVNETRPRVREITVDEARALLAANPAAILVDVREDSEWQAGRAAGAIHIGKGVLERDLERQIPDANAEILFYCGGGFRSILAADAAQRIGYRQVRSIAGGYKKMAAGGWEIALG